MSLNIEILSKAANQARGLCMDAVQASQSGHLGLPLGCAEIGAVLFGHALKYNPDQPRWINRDIFVLSGGHGSMFLYAWLHMSGYDLPMSEIERFRQLHSKTPGHPEFGHTPGVECTTGPLGQGIGNSVGISMATKMAAARFNTNEHKIFDQHVICLCSDGDMQEGVASEACALAGHWGLDNLIFIYDSNAVTLDAPAKETQSEDTGKRMEAYGFDVQEIDGHDMQQFLDAFNVAKRRDNGKPQFIIAHTLIGKGVPEVEGTFKAHGEAGAKYVDAARKALGLPAEHYFVSQEVYDYFPEHGMCAILNGISYHGLFRASGATFMVFTDYCRASIRLAALAKLPNTYIFTHDSIGVGEDGPTHEPVETVSSVRLIPNIDVIRPADPEETAGGFVAAMERIDGPTFLALTRQAVPMLNDVDVNLRREGVLRGAYIAKKEKGKLDLIIMSCGSELQHALAAAGQLGDGVRVVSLPCFERFNRQPQKYREEVLPNECRKRVAIEAGVTEIWYQYVGLDGKVIGLHQFGLSAPGPEVMKERGIDAQHVIDAAKALLQR